MAAMTEFIKVNELNELDSWSDPITLYRDVFGLKSDDPAPSSRLLAALTHNGGIVLGAKVNGLLAGFSYTFLGRDLTCEGHAASLYHYMELLVVRAELRNLGVGRVLMHRLRDISLARGVDTVRWAYDPLRTDNAYFYLDVLGARSRGFAPNLYGVEDTGRDQGRPTDRILAHWDLTAPPHRHWPPPPAGLDIGNPAIDPRSGTVLLAVPSVYGEHPSRDLVVRQQRICAVLGHLIADGFHAVSCQRATDGQAVYRLIRRDHAEPPQLGRPR
ncbi:GNAT family N-acetyltransferase [Nocardia sp. NPDC006630]|uniref:GNAT family N-acetyltransferase n=1 Tax=Nocardia sp. NPDC006630 TaxID=3157181 RepID=UPI0033A87AF4